jgi:DNA polymerase I
MADRDQTSIREVASIITEDAGIRLEYEAQYDWIAFCPRRNDDAGALTRYFGQQQTPDGQDPEYKYRGIEARQRSTPPFLERVQKQFIREYGQHRSPERVCDTLADFINQLEDGAVEAEALAIKNRVSKPLEAYTQATRNVAALQRAEDVGLSTHAGENVEYVVVDNDKQSRDRVQLLAENPETYDPEFYTDELIRATESVLAPMGWREADIREYLADYRDTTLDHYQDSSKPASESVR